MIGKLVTQLTALLTVSILFGLCLKTLNINLVYSIPLGIMLQFGLYYIFITILDVWVTLKNKKLENERIKEFSLQGMEVSCPCSLKKVEFVPITLNTNNNYKCNHCQKNVSVYITAETALVTEPLIMPQVPNIPTTLKQ
jgi:hypothetical protein